MNDEVSIDRDIAFFLVGVLEALTWEHTGQSRKAFEGARDHILERAGYENSSE